MSDSPEQECVSRPTGTDKVLPGFSHNISYRDRVYHLLSECSGHDPVQITTHLFFAGTVLGCWHAEPMDLVDSKDALEELERRLKAQHKEGIKALVRGKMDDKIAQLLGPQVHRAEVSPAPPDTAAWADIVADAPATAEEPPPAKPRITSLFATPVETPFAGPSPWDAALASKEMVEGESLLAMADIIAPDETPDLKTHDWDAAVGNAYQDQPQDDRRQDPRVELRIWCHSQDEGSIWLDGEDELGEYQFCYSTHNISLGGMFLESRVPMPVGSEITLQFRIPDNGDKITVKGRVVRSVAADGVAGGEYGMGLQIVDFQEAEQRLALSKFLQQLNQV